MVVQSTITKHFVYSCYLLTLLIGYLVCKKKSKRITMSIEQCMIFLVPLDMPALFNRNSKDANIFQPNQFLNQHSKNQKIKNVKFPFQ